MMERECCERRLTSNLRLAIWHAVQRAKTAVMVEARSVVTIEYDAASVMVGRILMRDENCGFKIDDKSVSCKALRLFTEM
jgi:hypothetical protein